MSATDLERPVRLMRASRRVNMFIVVLNVLILALDLTAGSGLAFVPATVIVLLLALIVAQTRRIGTLRARERDLNRPHMTAEDYRHLREMELELGWEPSEVPADAEVSPYASLTAGDIEEAHERLSGARQCRCRPEDRCAVEVHAEDRAVPVVTYCATCGRRIREASQGAALSGAGSLSAPMTGPGGRWRPLSELPEAEATPEGIPAAPLIERMRREPGHFADLAAEGRESCIIPAECPMCAGREHFAALARVGLERCLSYCPICLHRLFGPVPDGWPTASLKQWLEENWGWKQ